MGLAVHEHDDTRMDGLIKSAAATPPCVVGWGRWEARLFTRVLLDARTLDDAYLQVQSVLERHILRPLAPQ